MAQPFMPQMEPTGVGGLLDRTFKLYSSNFAKMLAAVAVVYVPYIVVASLMNEVAPSSVRDGTSSLVPLILNVLALLILAFVFLPAATGAVTYLVSEQYLGRSISLGDAYRRAFRRLGSILGASMLAGLIVVVGLLLLIVPGIIFILSFQVIVPAVIIEQLGATASLRRSWRLSKGERGVILGAVLVIWVLSNVIQFAGSTIGGLIFSQTPLLANIVGQLFMVLVQPLSTIVAVMIYYNLRVKKEGFDLEMLSQNVAGQSTTEAIGVPPIAAAPAAPRPPQSPQDPLI